MTARIWASAAVALYLVGAVLAFRAGFTRVPRTRTFSEIFSTIRVQDVTPSQRNRP